jgi:hypothetical protein
MKPINRDTVTRQKNQPVLGNGNTNIVIDDEDLQQRRQLNGDVLRNHYSFWAGMYVKKTQ